MSKDKIVGKKILRLLVRFLTAESTLTERGRVEEWENSDPDNRRFLKLLKALWNLEKKPPQPSDVEGDWLKVAERAGIIEALAGNKYEGVPSVKKKILKDLTLPWWVNNKIFKFAALVIVIVMLPFLWEMVSTGSSGPPESITMNDIQVARGIKKNLTLPDGSRVILDAGSTFRYPQQFSSKTRQVFLNGEAYFEISPKRGKPFSIIAHHGIIKVVGTKFNVKAWSETQIVKVAVVEGRVTFALKGETDVKPVTINPGQISTCEVKGFPSTPVPGDVQNHLGWLNRQMAFKNTDLTEILAHLERWHNIHFFLNKKIPFSSKLTVFIEDKPVKVLLDLISDLTDLDYRRQGQKVFLFPRANKDEL